MNAITINPNILWVGAAGFAALATGTLLRLRALRHSAGGVAKGHLGSLVSWWVVATVVMSAALLGQIATAVLFTAVSALALYEFLKLARLGAEARRVTVLAYVLIPLNYIWICLGWSEVFVAFIPLCAVFVIGGRMILMGRTQGFLLISAKLSWGLLLTVYCLSHAVMLFGLPAESNPVAGVAGWFLYLIILTESNDITQALIGRRFGKHRITPRISPNKTWEGFLGGVLATTLLAVILAGWLTPLAAGRTLQIGTAQLSIPYMWAAVAGVVIAVTGFFGDLTESALKRDAGVKDSGSLLPGQGGILDRIDSLTLTAPVFYYFVLLIA